jgi:hypothetical protein
LESLDRRNHLGYLAMDGKITLKLIFKEIWYVDVDWICPAWL